MNGVVPAAEDLVETLKARIADAAEALAAQVRRAADEALALPEPAVDHVDKSVDKVVDKPSGGLEESAGGLAEGN